jgi:pimeloyl-ACP methyl ester carboxylesterase
MSTSSRSIVAIVAVLLVPRLGGGTVATTDPQRSVPYGSNAAAGRYEAAGDARIYFEVYGHGRPVVLLHGDLFGYVDEYARLIPRLAERFQVVAIATRGHGRSEMGQTPLSYDLFAEDALAVIRRVTREKAMVVGFSGGAATGAILAARHPEVVSKLVLLGVVLDADGYREDGLESIRRQTPEALEKGFGGFFAQRRKLMPRPDAWPRLVVEMKEASLARSYLPRGAAGSIACPTLIAGGDRDEYIRTEHFVEVFRLIPAARLSIVPGCGHLILECRPDLVEGIILPFLSD